MSYSDKIKCGGCTLCCHESVDLLPTEDHSAYDTYFDPEIGAWRLNVGVDRKCIYLGEKGCTIYSKRPVKCRAFDCRLLYLSLNQEQRDERSSRDPRFGEIWKAARKRMPSDLTRMNRVRDAIRKKYVST